MHKDLAAQTDAGGALLRTLNSSTLSMLTLERNAQEGVKYRKICEIEERERNKLKTKEDCKSLISQTDYKIKSMKYQLSTLVSNGEGHIEIIPGAETAIEVFPATLVFARLYCKGRQAPLKVHLRYTGRGDVKVF